jgi:ADP-ribosylglycohydrolase
MAGSPFEFAREAESLDAVRILSNDAAFTDDTLMTVAVAEALLTHALSNPDVSDTAIKAVLIESMQRWARTTRLPRGGYGRGFQRWLDTEGPEPYGSFGNGAAMRVSPAGWLFETRERTEHWAAVTAIVSHNHAEGVRGAQAIAAAIFLARTGADRDEIRDYVERHYSYNLSTPWESCVDESLPPVSCQATVPEALICFLAADSFEDAIRKAVSLGFDTDTRGAIAGSVAEAFFGIDPALADQARQGLTPEMLAVVDAFYARVAAP